jgi:hypothetical protein
MVRRATQSIRRYAVESPGPFAGLLWSLWPQRQRQPCWPARRSRNCHVTKARSHKPQVMTPTPARVPPLADYGEMELATSPDSSCWGSGRRCTAVQAALCLGFLRCGQVAEDIFSSGFISPLALRLPRRYG